MMNQSFESRDRILCQMRYLLILSLVAMLLGCFTGRNVKPLTNSDVIEEIIAILPVSPENVVMAVESEQDYAKMAKKTNSTLDILARGKKSKLIGPKKVRKSLQGMADTETINLLLNDLGKNSKSWRSTELIEIGNRLKVKKIIRVKVDVLISGNEMIRWAEGIDGGSGGVGAAGVGKHWRGWISVTADLFDLSPPRHVTYDRGSAEYSGKIGLGIVGGVASTGFCCLPFPYAVGTTQAKALGQATRQAIYGVLNQSTGQKPLIAGDHSKVSDLDFVHVESEPASLYSEPSLESTVVDQVWSAMALKVVKEKDNWLQVEAPSGKKGWIAKNWLVKDIQTKLPSGRRMTNEQVPFIQIGVSTKDEIESQLGAPDVFWVEERIFAYNWEKHQAVIAWLVSHGYQGALGAAEIGKGCVLLIQFDQNAYVKRFEVTKRAMFESYGDHLREWVEQSKEPPYSEPQE